MDVGQETQGRAREFLSNIINKTLRVSTTDGRVFRGILKCTDHESNVVLANTYEYRQPSAKKQVQAVVAVAALDDTAKLDMTSRFLGLVVVPGAHVVKIELEVFASQYNAMLEKQAHDKTNTTTTE